MDPVYSERELDGRLPAKLLVVELATLTNRQPRYYRATKRRHDFHVERDRPHRTLTSFSFNRLGRSGLTGPFPLKPQTGLARNLPFRIVKPKLSADRELC